MKNSFSLKEIHKKLDALGSRLTNTYDVGVLIRAFLKYSPIPKVMLDKNQCIVLWTQKFSDVFNLQDMGDLSGMHIRAVLPDFCSSHSKFMSILTNVVAGKGKLTTSQDLTYEYQINPWPLNGEMGGSLVCFIDITTKHKLLSLLNDIPNQVNCTDDTKCIWEQQHGKEILRLAKLLVEEQ